MNSLKADTERKYGKQFVEIGILLMVANVMTAIFLWQSVLHGWKLEAQSHYYFHAFLQEEGMDTFFSFDSTGGYLLILRLIFSFLGNREELVLITNLVLQLLGVILLTMGVRKILGSFWCCIFSVIGGIFSVLSFPVSEDLPMHFLWCALGSVFYFMVQTVEYLRCKNKGIFVSGIFMLGMLCGSALYFDITGVLLFPSLLLIIRKKGGEKRNIFFYIAIILGCILSFLFLLFFIQKDSYDTISPFLFWIHNQLLFYEQNTGNLIRTLFLLVFFIFFWIVIGVSLITKRDKITVEMEQLSLEQKAPEDSIISQPILEQPSLKKEIMKKEEMEGTVKLLHNPLPLPKKHVKKEMKYAFEPSKEQMHYDLNNYDVNDDYDLK